MIKDPLTKHNCLKCGKISTNHEGKHSWIELTGNGFFNQHSFCDECFKDLYLELCKELNKFDRKILPGVSLHHITKTYKKINEMETEVKFFNNFTHPERQEFCINCSSKNMSGISFCGNGYEDIPIFLCAGCLQKLVREMTHIKEYGTCNCEDN